MSILNWFKRLFGVNNSESNFETPLEFQLPNVPPGNMDNTNHKEYNDFNDPFKNTNSFEETMNLFNSVIGNILRDMESQFSMNDDNHGSNSNIFIGPIDDTFNKTSHEEDFKTVPKANLMARDYYLKPSQTPTKLDEPSVRMSPRLNITQTSTYSYTSKTFNGKIITKEIKTRQLPGGIIEKSIIMKDGNQECITIITENSNTGKQTSNKQLINLDESQLNEFEDRFSKFKR